MAATDTPPLPADQLQATTHTSSPSCAAGTWGTVLSAALLLPGLQAPAQAETAPEQAEVAIKVLHYRDRQPGLERIHVNAPSLYVLLPFAGRWAVEGSVVSDTVSGASPRYHTAISGASRLSEERHAGDLKLTHYGQRDAWSVGAAYSTEHDYRSRTLSADYRRASEDNNTSWSVGAAFSDDTVMSSNDPNLRRGRQTVSLMLGLTQVWTSVDLLQFNLGANLGHGMYSDPYKFPDRRPDERQQYTAMLRWNHHFSAWDATLRSSWRYYADSFGVRANTLEAAWVQPLSRAWSLTPSLRYTSQRAARFYYDPVYDSTLGAPFPPGYSASTPQYLSGDQRLSAFGALTVGLKLAYQFDSRWRADVSLDRYEQRAAWRLGGSGSPGLAPFQAYWLQLGLSRKF